MAINIDWLGDGWTFYPEDERKQMDARARKQKKMDRVIESAVSMSAACADMGCVPVPLCLAQAMASLMQDSPCFSDEVKQDVRQLVDGFAEMIEEARKVRASFRNN